MNVDHSIPDIVLERYRLHELPEREAERIARLAEVNPQLRERLEALDRSDAEIRESALASRLEAGVRQRLSRGSRDTRSSRRLAYVAVPAVIAAAAALVVVVAPRQSERAAGADATRARSAGEDRDDRMKGLRPTLALYRRTANASETLADGAVARQGDLLRVAYRAAGRRYGVILSVDGRASVTLHLPSGGQQAVPLQRGNTVLLDQAYELDDAPRWERFYFITGSEPFAVAPIVDAARRVAASGRVTPASPLPLPQALEQSTFSIQKEARP